MEAISSKTLTPEVRSEIIRDVVTHMYGFVEEPQILQICGSAANTEVSFYEGWQGNWLCKCNKQK